MKRLIFIALLALLAITALTTSAGAVNLPAKQASLTSAQLQGGRLIWFQRNTRRKWSKHGKLIEKLGVGALYARELNSKTAERVYLPPAGKRIVSFKASAGRVVVGLATIAKDNVGPSEILELTPGATLPWPSASLATDPYTTNATTCGSRVELVGIRTNSDVLVQSTKLDGRGAKCELARQVSALRALPKSSPPIELSTRTSGWSNSKHWNLLPGLFPATGTWILQVLGGEYGTTNPQSVWNATTGESKLFTTEVDGWAHTEATSADGLLARDWNGDNTLFPDLGDPARAITLRRAGALSWFHVCGDSLLEISRKWSSGWGGKWTLYVRGLDGKTQRKLKAKVNAGTMFDTCDQNTAVFHRWRHDNGAHQWTVSLTQ